MQHPLKMMVYLLIPPPIYHILSIFFHAWFQIYQWGQTNIFHPISRAIVLLTSPSKPPPPPLADWEIYGKKKETRLKKFAVAPFRNQNVESVLYDRKRASEILKEENNELERKWKAAILLENTPRGNVIMYYDPFKNGFTYFSDCQTLSYPILNSVAMEYVVKFHCLDFFLDETVLSPNESAILKNLQEEEREEMKKRKEVMEGLMAKALPNRPSSTNTAAAAHPFLISNAQTRNTAAAAAPTNFPPNSKPKTEKEKETTPIKEKRRNKFIYLGKIANFEMIPKRKMKEKVITKPISYGEYKKLFGGNNVR